MSNGLGGPAALKAVFQARGIGPSILQAFGLSLGLSQNFGHLQAFGPKFGPGHLARISGGPDCFAHHYYQPRN